jgi:hypothetical protein
MMPLHWLNLEAEIPAFFPVNLGINGQNTVEMNNSHYQIEVLRVCAGYV